MGDNIISVQNRANVGKGAARSVRRHGLVPSVVYGGDKDSVTVALDPRIIVKGVASGHFFSTVYQLEIGDNKQSEKVLVRDVQFHPVTDAPLHVDFMRVTDRTKVTVSVPVVFQGDDVSPGLREGGVLNIVRHDVQLVCRAGNIPDELICDISEANIGDTLKISAIVLPDGVVPTITDRDFVIANLVAPKLVEEVEATEVDTDIESEVDGEVEEEASEEE